MGIKILIAYITMSMYNKHIFVVKNREEIGNYE